jgi:hypothetical protein
MPRQSRSAIRCHDALFHILSRKTLSLPTNNLTDGELILFFFQFLCLSCRLNFLLKALCFLSSQQNLLQLFLTSFLLGFFSPYRFCNKFSSIPCSTVEIVLPRS